MWKFYKALIRPAAKEFWTATDEVLTGIAILFFVILLLNRKLGEHAMTAWNGISAWWSAIPIALIVLYRLLRANYEQFAAMKQERDDALARLVGASGIPPYHPKIILDRYAKEGNTCGFFISNDGYPAYQISIPDVTIGATKSKLTFSRIVPRLVDRQPEQFFEAWIEYNDGTGQDAGGLRLYMTVTDTDSLRVGIIYHDGEYNKDGEVRWYRSTFLVERDTSSGHGLAITFVSQELIQKPGVAA